MSNNVPVGGVLVDAELDVLGKLFVELLVGVLVFGQLIKKLHALFDEIFPNDFQNFILLEHLTGDVQREVLGVDDAPDEVQVLGDQLFAVVHDEDTTYVKFNVILLLFVFEQIKRGSFGNEKEGTEF